jgi:Family of unknown function (DUF6152)
MKYRISVFIALVILLAAGAAWAHHSMSAVFDLNQRFTRTGTLTKLDWRNPHSYITVEAKNDQGQMETWLFEGPPPNVFRVLKVGKIDFENAIGKQIKVEAGRARDGSLKGLMRIITLPDGKVVLLCPQNC